MSFRIFVVPFFALVLSGCAGKPDGFSRAMEYSWEVHRVEVAGETYRVLEHPANDKAGGRIMTTPNFARAAGVGAVQGATLGLADAAPTIEQHRAAARARLDASGRGDCRIVDGYELIKVQYEFVYTCPGAKAP
jgi:hypothetical protein